MVSGFRFWHWLIVAAALIGPMLPSAAKAIPAFARQTEQPCVACHVGGFGPQLNDFGRDFKINGYVWGKDEVKPWEHLTVMAYGGFEHYNKANPQPGAAPTGPLTSFGANDNWSLDQASLFYGGRIYGKLGMMAQATYVDSQKNFSWDNTDIRYADTTDIGDHLLLYGLTINNNPTVQDVWQSTPAWGFPYASPGLAPSPAMQPVIAGALARTVVGAGVYAELDDRFYLEVAGYTGLTHGQSLIMGLTGADTADRTHGLNPYWRFTYDTHDGEESFEIGTYGMDVNIWPGNIRDYGSDHFTDVAIDATYQRFIDDNKHIISLYGTAIHEEADLASSYAQSVLNGTPINQHHSMNSFRANASYYYDNTYGFTLGRTVTTGKADPNFYQALYGTSSTKPDNSSWTLQLDYTPFGKEASYGAPFLNMRLFAQYTLYDKFDGGSSNYDGNGRSASNNNTLFVGLWTAF